ncbi:hypothetical protein NKR19_g1889 [Coniochaeta hoffmannii]|uniref:Uncharacterized protein n=1 Tax=Coniochaeta hoffmannii TaxID=91930 RepID=A0AA38SBL4_9PEZI|nr:hypothetical protein NKR19_g1889 [Coniochaeta hoffmannii]
MESFKNMIVSRRGLVDDASNSNLVNLLIALLSLVFLGLVLLAMFVGLRRVRKQQQLRQQETLPQYQDVKRSGNHRRLTIETKGGMGQYSVSVFRDGQPMLANPQSPPHSPDNVPEIHITFPDEEDKQGRRKSGRVVVVRLSEGSNVGLEPVSDEQLPAYEKESKTQFYSIDMNQIGGLKEKDRSDYH